MNILKLKLPQVFSVKQIWRQETELRKSSVKSSLVSFRDAFTRYFLKV